MFRKITAGADCRPSRPDPPGHMQALGVGSAALVCAAHPWGGRWAQHHGLRTAQEAERTCIFATAALSAGFAAYVPVTSSHWVVVPASSIASYAVLAGTCGAAALHDVPVLLWHVVLATSPFGRQPPAARDA